MASQIDVDRMDYLLRDSHAAGVAVGQFDAHYLIHSMVIVNHGDACPRTLGLTAKGVKAYEAFLWARQLMNRTVYFHHNIQVLEFIVEQLFRLVIDNLSEFKRDRSVSPHIPSYFKRVASLKRRKVTKDQVLDQTQDDYLRFTEDGAWGLIAAIAEMTKASAARQLATRVIRRQIPRHCVIKRGKKELLSAALTGNGLVSDSDFHILDVKSTMYDGGADKNVFVIGKDGTIQEVAEHSDAITMFRDRPEAEALLILLNDDRAAEIMRWATIGGFICDERSIRRPLLSEARAV